MSIRSLKRMKRRLIPVLAIAAAVVPTAAQAQPMLDGGSSTSTPTVVRPDDRGGRGLVYSQLAHRVSGLDQTRVIPGYNAPAQNLSGLDQTRVIPGYNAPAVQTVSDSSPSGGGFDWRILGAGLLAFAATLAVMSWTVAVRRHRHASPAV